MEYISEKLFKHLNELENLKKFESSKLDAVDQAAEKIGKSWSGSWLGYHSCIYYQDFKSPPPGDHFSQDWGLMDLPKGGSTGDWREYKYDDVILIINKTAKNPDLVDITKKSRKVAGKFEKIKSDIVSIISSAKINNDKFIDNLIQKINEIKIVSGSEFINNFRPTEKFMSHDIKALEGELLAPPHLSITARIFSIKSPFVSCENLSKQTRLLASHLQNLEKNDLEKNYVEKSDVEKSDIGKNRVGTNIFIGHGKSEVWNELKDFLQDRLKLSWDEFNRVPVAGVANIVRLAQMLDNTAFAFFIVTAEEEQSDGELKDRMNVVHEVGLFQGRLGFEKAIVLLEEGCEEFSNIKGLGQIRFPQGKISSVFEEIRQVLEREKLV